MKTGVILLGTDGGRSGIGRYAHELLAGLQTPNSGHDVDLVVRQEEESEWITAPGVAHTSLRLRGGALMEILWTLVALPWLAWRRKWDVAFFPAGNRRLPFWMPCPVVGTVHDFSTLHVPQKYGRMRSLYVLRVLPALIRRLARIITVSETSAHDIVTVTGLARSAISVIPNGVDLESFQPGSNNPEGIPYFLYVSRIEHPGKNHLTLIEAFDRFKTKTQSPHRLVFAGPAKEGADTVFARIQASPFAMEIECAGFVTEDRLLELYQSAAGVVMPSLYEGFGLPALEALATGRPTAVSSCPALVEVVGSHATIIDPLDVEGWAGFLTDPSNADEAEAVQRRRKHAEQFDWNATVERTLATLGDAGS